mgnify:CR=1 FL=1
MRGWLVRKKLQNLTYKDKGIIRIRASSFMELIRSDEAYLETIGEMLTEYIRPIQENASRYNIGSAAVKYLIRDVEELFQFNQKFFAKLCEVRDSTVYPISLHLGDVIAAESANLRSIYLDYANNYTPRVETLQHLRVTNSRFQAFLHEVSLFTCPFACFPVLT